MKTSSSIPGCRARRSRILSNGSSRERIARRIPSPCCNREARIIVHAHLGGGVDGRARDNRSGPGRQTPRSCRITPSTRSASSHARVSRRRGISSSRTTVLIVTYILRPRSAASCRIRRSCAREKFCAEARAENSCMPR